MRNEQDKPKTRTFSADLLVTSDNQMSRRWLNMSSFVVSTLLGRRAIALKWFGVDEKARTLHVALSPPPLVPPGTALKIPVKLGFTHTVGVTQTHNQS
jgi:hypothetical protein